MPPYALNMSRQITAIIMFGSGLGDDFSQTNLAHNVFRHARQPRQINVLRRRLVASSTAGLSEGFIGVHNEVSEPSKALRFLGGKVSVYGCLNAGQGDKFHSLCLLAASSPSRPKKALLYT
jgi:hypothetical protein